MGKKIKSKFFNLSPLPTIRCLCMGIYCKFESALFKVYFSIPWDIYSIYCRKIFRLKSVVKFPNSSALPHGDVFVKYAFKKIMCENPPDWFNVWTVKADISSNTNTLFQRKHLSLNKTLKHFKYLCLELSQFKNRMLLMQLSWKVMLHYLKTTQMQIVRYASYERQSIYS